MDDSSACNTAAMVEVGQHCLVPWPRAQLFCQFSSLTPSPTPSSWERMTPRTPSPHTPQTRRYVPHHCRCAPVPRTGFSTSVQATRIEKERMCALTAAATTQPKVKPPQLGQIASHKNAWPMKLGLKHRSPQHHWEVWCQSLIQ